jgi:hypothetical protein
MSIRNALNRFAAYHQTMIRIQGPHVFPIPTTNAARFSSRGSLRLDRDIVGGC